MGQSQSVCLTTLPPFVFEVRCRQLLALESGSLVREYRRSYSSNNTVDVGLSPERGVLTPSKGLDKLPESFLTILHVLHIAP